MRRAGCDRSGVPGARLVVPVGDGAAGGDAGAVAAGAAVGVGDGVADEAGAGGVVAGLSPLRETGVPQAASVAVLSPVASSLRNTEPGQNRIVVNAHVSWKPTRS